MLRWRLILEDYGPEIQYIHRAINILADAMERFPSNGQTKSTHDSNYIRDKFLEMYGIEELPNGTFLLKFTNINNYQQEYPVIKVKLKSAKIEKGYSRGGRNSIHLVT